MKVDYIFFFTIFLMVMAYPIALAYRHSTPSSIEVLQIESVTYSEGGGRVIYYGGGQPRYGFPVPIILQEREHWRVTTKVNGEKRWVKVFLKDEPIKPKLTQSLSVKYKTLRNGKFHVVKAEVIKER